MSTTSADVAGFAKGHTITHDGVTVEFKYLDDTLLAQYERDRFELERSKLNLLKNDYTREEYVERLDKLYNAYRKNEMALERDTEFRQSREGMMFLLGLMLQVEGKPISLKLTAKLFMERRDEVTQLLKVIMAESLGIKPDELESRIEQAAMAAKKGIQAPALVPGAPTPRA